MKLSIITTLYKTAPYIDEFYRRASNAAKNLTDDYEILFVDDGSPDDSLMRAVSIADSDNHVVVIDLSRNFGHHKAMMTGLSYARGEELFLIDSDLEEQPEWLLTFSEQMKQEGCDVVFGVQERRRGGWFERLSGEWFYKFFRVATGISLPENIITARLMTRRYVDALLLHDEREVFLAGLWHITGFDQRPNVVRKLEASESTYTFRHKMSVFVNSVTSFSNAPLRAIFYIGVIISLLAASYTLYIVLNWMFLSKPLSGWTSIMASVWLLGGAIISFIGVIGIYLSKIFSETKRRPYTIVRHIYGKRQD